jgi:iron-sulfur cluster repair protein YtfE (RIC family)
LLFPLREEKTGMSEDGPTFVMRAEHRQIGQQLEAIHGKVAEQNPDSDQEEQSLLDLLGSHNRKEERALFPASRPPRSPCSLPNSRNVLSFTFNRTEHARACLAIVH